MELNLSYFVYEVILIILYEIDNLFNDLIICILAVVTVEFISFSL
jgi:hypothetical protein